MTTEGPQNSFRERRSAFIEEGEEQQAKGPAAPPAEEPPIERPAPAAEPPATAAQAAADIQTSGESPAEEAELDEMSRLELPEPSFHEIVYEYAIRAQQFLGDAPITRDGQRRVLPNYAKHMIDLLGILEERTRGNLTPEESQLLDQVITDLRMRYVSVTS